MLRHFLFAACCLVFIPSNAHGSSQSEGFDVNDVTVLFPLDSTDQPYPAIKLDSTLVSDGVFSSLMIEATEQWISAPQGSSILKREAWSLVGFRYDPCAPTDTLGEATCIQELRLVAQSRSEFGPSDSSLHMIYRIGMGMPGKDDTIVRELHSLRDAPELGASPRTAGEPLSVHPILQAAMVQGNEAVVARFTSFIRRHATSERLQKLTMMGLRDGSPIDWIFIGGKVEGGSWTSAAVPNLGQNQRNFVELNLGGGADVFSPSSLDPSLSLESFFNNDDSGVEARLEEIEQAAHRIENPLLSNRLTVDCVSCHVATSVRLNNQFGFRTEIETLTATVPYRITAFPGPQMLSAHPTHWNLRSLGYFGLLPSISMRTVHESARVAEQLNTLLGYAPPGRDCSRVVSKVMACFVDSSRLFGPLSTKESCLNGCEL